MQDASLAKFRDPPPIGLNRFKTKGFQRAKSSYGPSQDAAAAEAPVPGADPAAAGAVGSGGTSADAAWGGHEAERRRHQEALARMQVATYLGHPAAVT